MRRPFPALLAVVVLAFLFADPSLTRAQHWSPANAPAAHWVQVAASADGTKVAAASGTAAGGSIYSSIEQAQAPLPH